MNEPVVAVQARRVTKTFGRTAALRGVSVTFRGSGLYVIEGSNGSGKSTLLQVLGGVTRPTTGEVRYDPSLKDACASRARLGWLSHETLCYGDLSGRENLRLSAACLGMDFEGIWPELTERFELGRFAERPVKTNSRGQRQRIALARALLHAPSLVLMDEPTTGLDKSATTRLLKVVDEEVARGALVVVVTHDHDRFGHAKHKVTLERGQVVGEQPAAPD